MVHLENDKDPLISCVITLIIITQFQRQFVLRQMWRNFL